jgi:hypothetical protein
MTTFYTHTTWAGLKSALALRLGDTGNVYWSSTELGLYLAEALRTFGLLTGFWRDKGLISTVAATPFYDLTTLQNGNGENLLSYTVKDQDIVSMIQYHFLEPATGNSWTGSNQFGGLADITASIQKRRDQLLSDTGCVVTRTSGIVTAAGTNSILLLDSIVAIRRLAFIDSFGIAKPLLPSDILSQRNYSSTELHTPGEPYSYSSAASRPTEILLVPPTNQPGTLDLVSVQSGATLNPAVGVLLGLPDDYCWAVKWGAMADLLSKDGPARDSIRAAYCERRYQLAVELIRISPVVINAEITGIPLDTDSLTNMDAYDPDWQTTLGTPSSIASIRTLVALALCPDNVYSITFDVVTKAPIPASDSDYVQVGREQLDPILDYAEHLATFKMGGEEFRSTFKGAENFFNAAVAYNERLTSMNSNTLHLMRQSSADKEDRPYRVPGGLGALQGQPLSGGSASIDSNEVQQTDPENGQMG